MSTAGLVLAAGSSHRMGSPKQLLPMAGGKPLLELVVGQANQSKVDQVTVVLGAAAEEIRSRVDLGRATVLVNPDHASGMASSLRAGLASLGADVDRVVVILGDQPDVDATRLNQLLDLQETSGLPAAALSFSGLLHPPVVLERGLWGDLMALEGDVGCRAVIRAKPELVAKLQVAGDRKHPIDVDTPEDYERFRPPSASPARAPV
ncbi:MAG TPA: nucleotidyltransferase family protein [Candidatus Dormibacteraeota bacterium]|nr:nucleotidyltransferase family protein [Candidatus Dormibacteraeota bacterium]